MPAMTRRYCPMCRREVETPRDALASLRAFPASFQRVIASLSPREVNVTPRAGEWTARELAAHMADCEVAVGWRLRMMAAQQRPPLTPFDQDAWAAALNYRGHDLKNTLDLFASLRRANCDLLKAGQPGIWDRAGVHQEHGEITVRQMMDHFAHHDLHHLNKLRDKIRRIRAGERA
ncbi:MAG: DinB family protein [Armatimonadetes bacterium]|nr:DinB family protein [Armatimonadota bacterium]